MVNESAPCETTTSKGWPTILAVPVNLRVQVKVEVKMKMHADVKAVKAEVKVEMKAMGYRLV